MIRYALVCAAGHDFEGWFGSSGDFDDQSARSLVACPMCGSAEVRKQIMAPAVVTAKGREAPAPGPSREMMMEMASRVRQHVEDNFDYVGDAFAREARAIHEGRSEERGIYGEATPEEARALAEDGVPVAPLPQVPPDRRDLN
ncbi:MAG: hypothetical protein RL588_362 [Pseudomonadota bacterium]